jgi:myosin heavy subunit
MSDENMSLKMKIDTSYNGTGTKAAAKDVKTLDTTQKKANKTVNASKKAGINASAGFGAAGAAAGAAANGGISGISSAMGQMLQEMEGVAAFAGTGGLMLGAFAAWKSAINSLSEAHKQLQNNIDGIKIGNLQSSNKRLKESYKEITDQINAASAAVTRFYSEQGAADNAAKRYDMALIDQEDAKKRAKLDPSDTFGSQRLTVETAEKKAYLEKEYERNRLEAQKKEIAAQKSIAENKNNDSQEYYQSVDESITKTAQVINEILTRAQADASKAWTAKGKKNVWADAGKEIETLKGELVNLRQQFVAATKDLEKSRADLRSIEKAAEINYRDTETNKLTYDISKNTVTANRSSINYSEREKLNQERKSSVEGMNKISETQSTMKDRVRKEWREAQKASSDGSSPEKIAKEMEDWRAAAASVKKYMNTAGPIFKSMKETADRAIEALNNLPSS